MKNDLKIIFAAFVVSFMALSCTARKGPVKNSSSLTVVDPSGRPVPGAVVSIEYQGNMKSFTPDKKGAFNFKQSSLAQGELSISARGYSTLRVTLCQGWNWSSGRQHDLKFTVYPDINPSEKASGFGELKGIVVDAERVPIPGASIRAEGTSNGAASGLNGSYKILKIPSGIYTFTCYVMGYSKTSIEQITILSDTTIEREFMLFDCPSILDPTTIIYPHYLHPQNTPK